MDYLIVAIAGRMLAQSAARGGYRVGVLDLFDDVDTGRHAAHSQRLRGRDGGLSGFDSSSLRAALAQLPAGSCEGIVYGSGFEDDVPSLRALAARASLLGNPPELVERMKDPSQFFALLDELGIPHPQVSFAAPEDPQNWLAKRIGGSGGAHVRNAVESSGSAQRYFQRFVHGTHYSVSFLANAKRALILGFNEPWTVALGNWPYCYAGAISRVELPQAIQGDIAQRLDRLVERTGLVGLNGMDFVVRADGHYQVIEVNPRPSGTLDLYDADCPQGLFHWHLRACASELPRGAFATAHVRAHAVVYARRGFRLRTAVFPDWCSDLPRGGAQFAPRMPVCMVHAQGKDHASVRALVSQRRAQIEQLIAREAA